MWNGKVLSNTMAFHSQFLSGSDEFDMRGGPDPDDRRMFDWSQVSSGNVSVALYHRLIAIRMAYPALSTASCMTLLIDDANKTRSSGRIDQKNRITVFLNQDSLSQTVTIPGYQVSMTNGSGVTD
jgi:alpha-glucosidase